MLKKNHKFHWNFIILYLASNFCIISGFLQLFREVDKPLRYQGLKGMLLCISEWPTLESYTFPSSAGNGLCIDLSSLLINTGIY